MRWFSWFRKPEPQQKRKTERDLIAERIDSWLADNYANVDICDARGLDWKGTFNHGALDLRARTHAYDFIGIDVFCDGAHICLLTKSDLPNYLAKRAEYIENAHAKARAHLGIDLATPATALSPAEPVADPTRGLSPAQEVPA